MHIADYNKTCYKFGFFIFVLFNLVLLTDCQTSFKKDKPDQRNLYIKVIDYAGNVTLDDRPIENRSYPHQGTINAATTSSWVIIEYGENNRFLLKNASVTLSVGYPVPTDIGYVNDPSLLLPGHKISDHQAFHLLSGTLYAHTVNANKMKYEAIFYTEAILIEPGDNNSFSVDVSGKTLSLSNCGGSFFVRPYFSNPNMDLSAVESTAGKLLSMTDRDYFIRDLTKPEQKLRSDNFRQFDISTFCAPR